MIALGNTCLSNSQTGITLKLAQSAQVYNLPGQLIRLIRVDNSHIKIDNLPSGVLIVNVSLQGEKIEMKKVLMK